MPARLTERQVAGLTGLSPRSIRRRACELRTEPADSASRNGRKARVFHLGSLNPTLQQAFVDSSNVPPALALAVTLPPGPNISEENRAEAEKRYQIIEPIVRPDSFRLLWAEYRNRRSKVIEGLASKHEISRRALYSWLGAWKKGGLLGLVKQKRQDSGEPRSLNPAALDFLLTAAFPSPGSYGQLSVREIHRAYQEERQWRLLHATKPLKDFEKRKYARYLGEDECLLPTCQLPELSCETLRRWSHRIPEAVKIFARGETAFFNNCEILSFRDLKEVLPLDYVVMDHRRLDVFCLVQKRGGWALARPWLTGAVDMRTRRWLAWAIVETPSSDSIASVLKTVLMRFGVPKALYIDNGKDFTCEYLEGTKITRTLSPRISDLGARTRGVLETLGIRVTHAIVRRARSKIIEPCFIATANFDKILPEYCGHKPNARPERLQNLIEQHERWKRGEAEATPFRTIEEIASLYEEQFETINEREHPGEGMEKITPTGRGWMAPNEAWELLIGGVEVRTASPEVLQFIFQKRRKITVRHGEVRVTFGGRAYHYRMLDSAIQLVGLHGREVEVGFDPFDLQSIAVYCEGSFLGLAANAELRRMGESAFVEDEKARRLARREVKRFIQQVHAAVPMAGPEERAARRMAVRPKPVASEIHGTEITVPAEIRDAVEAAAKERQFSFAAASGPDLVRLADARAYEDDKDTEFEFFGERQA